MALLLLRKGSMANHKLIDLDVFETSGVDRAAHLHDGFIVMKSAETENRVKAQLLDALGMSEEDNLSSTQEQIDLAVAKAVGEYNEKVATLEAALEAAKNQAADLAEKLDAIQAMQSETPETEEMEIEESMDEEMKSMMEEMPEELAKSVKELPAEQRSVFAKAFKAQADEIRKEKDDRLDSEAITKSKETYKNVGIDHTVVAPALRRLEITNPEIAKAIAGVLASAEAQIAESGLLKEFGTTTGETPSVVDEAKAIAKGLVESGVAKTIEQGIEKALDANPELAKRYMEEVKG
jgi:dGTP triphosphohydrolase